MNNQSYPGSISIIGAGNMAWHLAHTFFKAKVKIDFIINRSINKAKELAEEIGANYSGDYKILTGQNQYIILAISDSSIESILEKINPANNIIIHTSGSVGIDIFKGKALNYGVLYPFQTLTKNINVNFLKTPVFIEASDDVTYNAIYHLVSKLSDFVYKMDSDQRRKLHLGGVMANNFVNHLITLTFDFFDRNGIDTNLALPLINETIRKIENIGPAEAQTGPARRNNLEVINKHINMLNSDIQLKNLYKAISDSIIAYYSK